MTNSIYDILRRPIITEKSSYQSEKLNQVVFEVAQTASKPMIKDAIETIFDVTVIKINTLNSPAKQTRRGNNRRLAVRKKGYKKAIITLQAGDSIDVFEGVH